MGTVLLRVLVLTVLLGFLIWAAAAIRFDAGLTDGLATAAAAAAVVVALTLLIWCHPFARAVTMAAAIPLLVLAWWLSIAPSNARDWQPDVSRLPAATIDGDVLTVHNLRNFSYRSESDQDEHWESRTYDLSKLVGVDLFVSYWGPTLIAHTVTSWEFSDGSRLAISIETRKERGEQYSAVRGFFRQFELYYVVADERDVIGVRTGPRAERVFLYRLAARAPEARALLTDYLDSVNELAVRPAWYNAFTHNCTTVIWQHSKQVGSTLAFDWRVLANGHLDAFLYERGSINTSLPFAAMRQASDITERAREAAGAEDFSLRIREGLPERAPRS